MNIIVGSIAFSGYKVESQIEMTGWLDQCDDGMMLLEENAQSSQSFYVLIVQTGLPFIVEKGMQPKKFGIGVVSELIDVAPSVLLVSSGLLVISYGFHLVGISTNDWVKQFEEHFSIPVHSLMMIPPHNAFAVRTELGVIVYSIAGERLAQIEKDVVTRAEFVEDTINLYFMDEEPEIINLTDLFSP